jgi:restriction system protein
LPSGAQVTYKNRVGWAKTYLKKAGLLQSPKRGYFLITEKGKKLLEEPPEIINQVYLTRFDSFNEFISSDSKTENTEETIEPKEESDNTPEEIIENTIEEMNAQLAQELHNSLMELSPSYFEHVVIELLVKMGYGGSRKEASKVVGKSHDGGIDGIIKEDKLGLDAIYIQVKRWQNNVGRPLMQAFVGALEGNRAKKGVFITTSDFTKGAKDYVKKINSKVVLIDGKRLSELMIEYELGVTTIKTYKIKHLDTDYFIEE